MQGVVLDTRTHDGTPAADASERISVRFAAGPDAAASARNALAELDGRLEPAALDDIRLLVSELVTNSVRHSRTTDGKTIGLDVWVAGGTVRVEVFDDGIGFEPRPRQPGQSKAGGWGLYLVERLADRWGVVRNHFTRVWFEIDARGQRPGIPR